MGVRRQSRELALQFLYSQDFQDLLAVLQEKQQREELFRLFCLHLTRFTNEEALQSAQALKVLPYTERLIAGLASALTAIDALLVQHSHNWRLARMSLVDRNILRLAIYEMLYEQEIPPQVAINEALEIARRYSVKDSVPFINGILDSVHSKGLAQSASTSPA